MLFIAEIGLNHNGNFGLLNELIRQAKLSGADLVKFQLGWRGNKGEINYIDDKTLRLILKISDYYSIEPMFSIFTDEALVMAKKYNFKKYKIASRTLIDNFALAKRIIAENKETFVSLGFWKKKNLPFKKNKPSLIIANTIKGSGVSFIENVVKWHHKVPSKEEFKLAINELNEREKKING